MLIWASTGLGFPFYTLFRLHVLGSRGVDLGDNSTCTRPGTTTRTAKVLLPSPERWQAIFS